MGYIPSDKANDPTWQGSGPDEDGDPTECELCGEPILKDRYGVYKEDVGEFWDVEANDSVIAHGQCGIDAGLDLA